jgi:hypothetical protein
MMYSSDSDSDESIREVPCGEGAEVDEMGRANVLLVDEEGVDVDAVVADMDTCLFCLEEVPHDLPAGVMYVYKLGRVKYDCCGKAVHLGCNIEFLKNKESYVSTSSTGMDKIKCPNCRHGHQLPGGYFHDPARIRNGF